MLHILFFYFQVVLRKYKKSGVDSKWLNSEFWLFSSYSYVSKVNESKHGSSQK